MITQNTTSGAPEQWEIRFVRDRIGGQQDQSGNGAVGNGIREWNRDGEGVKVNRSRPGGSIRQKCCAWVALSGRAMGM